MLPDRVKSNSRFFPKDNSMTQQGVQGHLAPRPSQKIDLLRINSEQQAKFIFTPLKWYAENSKDRNARETAKENGKWDPKTGSGRSQLSSLLIKQPLSKSHRASAENPETTNPLAKSRRGRLFLSQGDQEGLLSG